MFPFLLGWDGPNVQACLFTHTGGSGVGKLKIILMSAAERRFISNYIICNAKIFRLVAEFQ